MISIVNMVTELRASSAVPAVPGGVRPAGRGCTGWGPCSYSPCDDIWAGGPSAGHAGYAAVHGVFYLSRYIATTVFS